MMIFSPFLITQCSLLTPSRFVQPSFCRDPFPIGTKEWKYPVDWLRIRTPELWLDVSRIIYEIYVPLSRDHLWSLDISPRLLTVTHTFLPPCDDMSNDDRSEFLSRVLSRVCQVSFGNLSQCHIQTNITSVMKHKHSWVMSDHQGSQTERMKTFQHKSNKHTFFFSSFGFHFPLFVKMYGNWRGHTPAHLSPDPGNYTALQPISMNVSLPPPSSTLMLRLILNSRSRKREICFAMLILLYLKVIF